MNENLENMEQFSLDEEVAETKTEGVLDPLDALVNHDFSNGEEINLDESYEMLQQVERINKEAKANEAENVIDDISDTYIDEEYKKEITKSIDNVKSFIKKYNIEKEEIKNLNDKEKTKLFAIGTFLLKNVGKLITDLKFNISLTRDEYRFIYMALERKISYDGNEVFNIIDLNEKYLKQWKELDKSLDKTVPTFVVDIDIKNVVMLYHFLQKHTVKGIGAEFYNFAQVLQKIADTNKIYNAYSVIKERLDIDFNIWTSAMESQEVQGQIPPKGDMPTQQ